MKIAIVGAGKLGMRIAETLIGGDHSITIIDRKEDLIRRLNGTLDVMTVSGNGKETALLKEIGISSYDFLIATTDRDEKNIVIASIAKKLGVGKVVARLRDPEHLHQWQFIKETFGIDYVTNPDRAVAEEIYKYLVEKYSWANGVIYVGQAGVIEFRADKMPEIVGLTHGMLPDKLGNVSVVAYSRNGKLSIPKNRDTVIRAEDFIYLIGERDHIDELAPSVSDTEQFTDIQRVMIAGGGKSGFYLASLLEEFGTSVKIVENNKERCQYLSTHLNNALVLYGDATDLNLLRDEDFRSMDAFVSTTGFDEENLLLALMAKQAGIADVIAKVSRDSFAELVEHMGVDMALNPIDISASNILRFIQSTRIISSQTLQGQAEMLQLLLGDDLVILDKPIGKLKLPEGLVIAAIQRGSQLIVPDEKTKLMQMDRIIVLSMLSEAFDIERLLRNKGGFFK
ncbi:MAG: Trk system potassium transporter TrkA [Clostridiales Family XIII bacterium]|jgi:trk system potassium uptake protein TrkA|nr:Trk system potassium transporter TrkA [Clostridiales Family XIII bacterium]